MKKLLITFLLVIALATVCADEVVTADFTMDNVDPIVTVTAPANADVLASESTSPITWSATDGNIATNPITIEYRDNSGEDLAIIASTEVNDGTYAWTTPDVSSATAEIKITVVDNFGNSGTDNSIFTIANDYGDYVETIVDVVDPPVINLPVINFGTADDPDFKTPSILFTFATAPSNHPLSGQVRTLPVNALPNANACLAALQTNLPSGIATTIVFDFKVTNVSPNELVRWNGSAWEDITGSVVSWEPGKVTFTWTSATRGDEEFSVNNGEESTLPVELSSFNAVQTSSNFAELKWQTASEDALSGYHIYRNSTSDMANSVRVNMELIPATNTTLTSNYSFTDEEVALNNDYYYWLQSNEINGTSQFFGPVMLSVNFDDNTDLEGVQMVTGINSLYPNPFNPSTTLSYYLTDDSAVKVEIYNSKGQLVRSFNEGTKTGNQTHTLVWNGNNQNSKPVSSGVYFFRLNAGNKIYTNKAILVK